MEPFRAEYEVDILVRGSGNAALAERCLASVLQGTQDVPYMLTYVDGGTPTRDYLHLVQRFVGYQGVQLLRLPFNHGSVRAINYGLSLALWSSAPWILLLDNDTEVPQGDPGWLRRFIGYMTDEHVAAAGAVTDYVVGAQNVRAYPDRLQGQPPLVVPTLVSFALLLRKSAVEQVQYFDERYEPGNYEDHDYCLQLGQAGHRCVVADSVWLHHLGSQTFGRGGFQELLDRNKVQFHAKWGPQLAKFGICVNGGQSDGQA
jgi:GT2 family glycosyltransferase